MLVNKNCLMWSKESYTGQKKVTQKNVNNFPRKKKKRVLFSSSPPLSPNNTSISPLPFLITDNHHCRWLIIVCLAIVVNHLFAIRCCSILSSITLHPLPFGLSFDQPSLLTHLSIIASSQIVDHNITINHHSPSTVVVTGQLSLKPPIGMLISKLA